MTTETVSVKRKHNWELIALCAITLISHLMILQHGVGAHPDERHIISVTNKLNWNDLNPHSFAYGSLIFYLLKAFSAIFGLIHSKFYNYQELFSIGRILSAIMATMTVAFTYSTCLNLKNCRITAATSALFLVFAPLFFQSTHFYISDVHLTLIASIIIWYGSSLNSNELIKKNKGISSFIFFGFLIGAGCAVKVGALSLLIIPTIFLAFIAYKISDFKNLFLSSIIALSLILTLAFIFLFNEKSTFQYFSNVENIWKIFGVLLSITFLIIALNFSPKIHKIILLLLILFTSTIASWFILAPYTFIDWKEAFNQINHQLEMVKGNWVPPYTLQYKHTTPYWYHIKQMGSYCIGWIVLIPALIGLFFEPIQRLISFIKNSKTNSKTTTQTICIISTAIWIIAFFITVGGSMVKFPRYLLPLYPSLAIFSALFATRIAGKLPKEFNFKYLRDYFQNLSTIQTLRLSSILIIVLIFSIKFIAHLNIYSGEHTYKVASRWIYENIPAGSKIFGVHWDDKLPIDLPKLSSRSFSMHGADFELPLYDSNRPDKFKETLEKIFDSNYIIFPTDRLPGSIQNVKEQYPRTAKLFSLLYKERLGFKFVKTIKVRPSFFGKVFKDDLADESFTVYTNPRVSIFKNTSKFSTTKIRGLVSSYNEDILTRDEIINLSSSIHPKPSSGLELTFLMVLFWFVLWQALGIIGIGTSTLITNSINADLLQNKNSLNELPIAFSRTIGFLILTLTLWGLNLIEGIYVNSLFVALTIILLTIINLFITPTKSFLNLFSLKNTANILWLGIGVLFIFVRSMHPEIFWGEKPMDMSFLNYFTKETKLPPTDPWASGSIMSYYYLGQYGFAQLLKVAPFNTGIGYNLSLITIPALFASIIYGCLLLATNFSKSHAICGTLLITLGGNLSLLLTYLTKYPIFFITIVLIVMALALTKWFNFSKIQTNVAGFFAILISGLTIIFLNTRSRIPQNLFDWFWSSSRVYKEPGFSEYPLWSFLFGDLHAHVISAPFLALIVASIFIINVEDPEKKNTIANRLLIGLTLGFLLVCNTWDFMLGCGTILVALFLNTAKQLLSEYDTFAEIRLKIIGNLFINNFLAPVIIFLPIFLAFKVTSLSHQAGSANLGWTYNNEFNNISHYILMFGLWLAPILISGVISIKNRKFSVFNFLLTIILLYTPLVILFSFRYYSFGVNIPFIGSPHRSINSLDGAAFDIYLLSGLFLIIAFQIDSLNEGIKTLLISVAGIFSIVETFFIFDRMNTVFKFLSPMWWYLGIVAVGLTYTVQSQLRPFQLQKRLSLIINSGFTLTSGIIIYSTGLICIITMTSHYRIPVSRPHLDGTDFLNEHNSSDYGVIQWLNKNWKKDDPSKPPSPSNILEASGNSYGDYTRISTYTGLPTIAGWEHHVKQRGLTQSEYNRRKELVTEIYSTNSVARAVNLLKNHDIKYIIIGNLEKRSYPLNGIAKFKATPSAFKEVYSNTSASIFTIK